MKLSNCKLFNRLPTSIASRLSFFKTKRLRVIVTRRLFSRYIGTGASPTTIRAGHHKRSISTTAVILAAMSSKLIPLNPDDVMVIRNVTPSIVTFSVPFSRFGTVKIGGRGTLVKLTSGNLAVFSPVALTEDTKRKVAEMGNRVEYIVALDIEHHIFISEWKKEYPTAKIIGPEGLPEKRAKQHDLKIGKDKFDVIFTKTHKRETKISQEFDADFDYEYVDGHGNRELVFCWKPEGVLIEADLLFNLPATEQYSRVPEADRKTVGFAARALEGLQNPEGDNKWMKRFNWYVLAKDRASFNDSLGVIEQWDFSTLIPCHGDVLEGNGKEVFRKVFEWHLDGKSRY